MLSSLPNSARWARTTSSPNRVLPPLHLSIAHLKCSIRSARLARRKSAGAAPSLTPLTPILLGSRETRDAFLGAGRRAEFSESFPRPPEAWHCEYDSAIEMLPKTAFLLKRRRGPGNPRRDLARPRLGSGLRQKKKMASHSSMGEREVVSWEGRGEGPHNNRATRRPTPKAKQHRVQPRHENDYLSAYRIQEHHTP